MQITLTNYIEKLQELLQEHGDLELIYSSDDEGNNYDNLAYLPSVVNYNSSWKEVISDEDLEEYNESDYKKVICVN